MSACILSQIPLYSGFYKNEKGHGASFLGTFFDNFFCNTTKASPISLPDCVYVKRISCTILRHLITS